MASVLLGIGSMFLLVGDDLVKHKVWKTAGLAIFSAALVAGIIISEINSVPAVSSIAGLFLGFSLPALWKSIQDIADNTKWKTSQRKLKRGEFIDDNTVVRISFAYLYRIKVGSLYLLVQNTRNTGKYQPVGGVYKMHGDEKIELKNQFHVMDDNKIPIDESSRNDYRLRMLNKYLRKFVIRFEKQADRERIDNIGREFKEEIVDTKILNWDKITYRFCGRHISELKFEEHFQVYELQLFDVAELLPTPEQEKDLKELTKCESEKIRFAKAEEIRNLGMNIDEGKLNEWIGSHSKYILEEEETKLMSAPRIGERITVSLNDK